MKKCELLSPAGNMTMLKYAVQYGADAVYLAGTRFGARKFANNFDDEELVEAVKYAHLFNVKVYVTINTLIYDDEVNDFVEYVKFIHNQGVDAVLVQDLGMIKLIRKIAPQLEIHASTQFHNDGAKTVEFLKTVGVKRVVLDRELSLKEIEKLPKKLELEVFCHGALCVSYSGQCLFSSQILGRSGNRGECAGLCRLPYKLKKNGEVEKKASYHLSLKDLYTVDYVHDLIEAGISCLKIEGRMKSPEYVGYMTKIYRKLIDAHYDGTIYQVTEEEMKNIQILFNRGLTRGFLNGAESSEIVNKSTPNHIGIHAGKYRSNDKKIELVLDEDIHQGDTIRFQEANLGMIINFLYDKKDNLINKSAKNTVAYVDNFLDMTGNGELRLVAKDSLSKEISTLPKRTVPISMIFRAHLNKPMILEVTEGKHAIKSIGSCPQKAQKRPVSEEEMKRQLQKTGETVYSISNIEVEAGPDLFINLKDINDLRRTALASLDELRTTPKKVEFKEVIDKRKNRLANKTELIVCVDTEEQYEIAQKYSSLVFSSNENLLKKYENINPKYVNPEVKGNSSKYMISHYGSFVDIEKNDIVFTDYMMNVTNSHTVEACLEHDISTVGLSIELTTDRIEKIASKVDASKIAVFVYGKIELMKMKYDPSTSELTELVDHNGSSYKIVKDSHFNYLLSSKPKDLIDEASEFIKMGIGYLRVDFKDETQKECEKILERLHKIIRKE